VVLFGDEASFWLDGTLHQTWARIGEQPRVDTYGQRQTAHVFGAVHLNDAKFTYQFAERFTGDTFWCFLRLLVRRYNGRKVFLIIDNAPFHRLETRGVQWLRKNRHRISLHRLPPYSPELNPVEPIWKTTRKLATHNRFYQTTLERDTALRRAFQRFYATPAIISAHLARFQ
jgi:transposase